MKYLVIVFVLVLGFACNSTNKKVNQELSATPDTLKTVLHVEGMTCDHCEMTVQGSVNEIAGIVSIKADHVDSSTVVSYDASQTSLSEISKAIEKKGYKVVGEK